VPFRLSLASPGTFDKRGRIDALWVGVTPQGEVTALARRIDQALQRVGVAPETRAFVPHITVARFGRDMGPLGAFPMQPLPVEPFEVSGFALWESVLSHDGSDYRILERYPI
jgi:2'-5' RNA ligase